MIIYGLVILVALSVIAGLLYFGVLDIGNYLPESCDLGGTGDLKCEEFSFAGGVLQVGLRNTGQKQIQLLTGTATDKDGIHFSDETASSTGTVDGNVISGTNTLAPGGIALVQWNTASKPGKVLNARLDITYMYKDGAVTQTAVGDLRVKAAN